MSVALSDLIPLRTSAAWSNYKTVRALPVGYGSVTVSPVQMDRDGYEWLILDHPIMAVTSVTRKEYEENGYEWKNDVDETNAAIAKLELAEAAKEGDIAVTCNAKIHPVSGGLMTNPADVLWDIMANLLGMDIEEGDLDIFRRECQELSIEIAGILGDHRRTTRSYIDEIARSIGAVSGGGMPGFARIYPREMPTDEPLWKTLSPRDIPKPTATASHGELFTVLRILYDWNSAEDKPAKTLELEAVEPKKEYGSIVKEIQAKWINSTRVASQLGERLLTHLAKPRWRVSAECPYELPSGGYVSLYHSVLPISDYTNAMILSSEHQPGVTGSKIEVEISVGSDPTIEVTKVSEAFGPPELQSAVVDYRDGVLTFGPILDESGQPIVGARAWLDGNYPQVSDGAGKVYFPATAGTHVISIEVEGYEPYETEVTIG